jgi:hypothetical protein
MNGIKLWGRSSAGHSLLPFIGTETLVFRQDDPTALSHFLEPNTVLFISLEMIVMDFYGDSRLDGRATCWLDAQ